MPTKHVKHALCNANYCHFCGYGSDWEKFRHSNMVRHMETFHSTLEECLGTHYDPPTRRNQTWRVLDEAHPDLIVCIEGENGNTVSAVYCLECNRMEQVSSTEYSPLVRFPTHTCPTDRGTSKLKGTKRVKATEPAVGGAGVAPAPPTRALVVQYDWLKAHGVDVDEGNVMDNLAEELEISQKSWQFEKAAKAAVLREAEALKQLAEAKLAAPVAAGGTVDLSTAAAQVADALCSDSSVGRIVRGEKTRLQKQEAEDISENPLDYEPYTPYGLLVDLAKGLSSWRTACEADRKKAEKAEEKLQTQIRQLEGELARQSMDLERTRQNLILQAQDTARAEARALDWERQAKAALTQPTPP
jgi:hypothetical protein